MITWIHNDYNSVSAINLYHQMAELTHLISNAPKTKKVKTMIIVLEILMFYILPLNC